MSRAFGDRTRSAKWRREHAVISIDYLTGLLSRMGHGAYLLVFAGAMLESAAMLGLIVPGEALVLVAGFFAAQHVFDLDALITGVAIGAALGDSIGYGLGRRLGRPALVKYGGRVGLTEARVHRVEAFFARHGPSSVFLGRFVGFARALVPFLAGTSRMPYRSFLPYNVAGAVLWSVLIVLAGYFLGTSWQRVETWIGRASAMLAGVIALGWLLRRHWRRPPAVWIEIGILVLAVCLFGSIAEDVATGDPITKLDVQLVQWFETHRLDWLTPALTVLTQLHAPVPMGIATAAVAVWLATRHDWLWFKTLMWIVPGGMLFNTAVKLLFHRERPVLEHPILTLTTYSFPSGHVAGPTLFYGFVCAFVFSHTRRNAVRAATAAVCLAIVLLVAFSRMYLGAHFLSDVLGAFAEAAAWLALCIGVLHGSLGKVAANLYGQKILGSGRKYVPRMVALVLIAIIAGTFALFVFYETLALPKE